MENHKGKGKYFLTVGSVLLKISSTLCIGICLVGSVVATLGLDLYLHSIGRTSEDFMVQVIAWALFGLLLTMTCLPLIGSQTVKRILTPLETKR